MERVASAADISQAREGPALEIDDFEALIAAYHPRVFRFLLAALRDRDLAETLTQEAFLKAFQGRSKFRGEASLNTWIMQIAVNVMRDHLRNRRWQFWRRASQDIDAGEVSDYLRDEHSSPEDHALAKEQVAAIWRAAEELPQRQRTVFLLRFVEEMDLREIAAATGAAEGTVKAQLFQALKTVRQQLLRTRSI